MAHSGNRSGRTRCAGTRTGRPGMAGSALPGRAAAARCRSCASGAAAAGGNHSRPVLSCDLLVLRRNGGGIGSDFLPAFVLEPQPAQTRRAARRGLAAGPREELGARPLSAAVLTPRSQSWPGLLCDWALGRRVPGLAPCRPRAVDRAPPLLGDEPEFGAVDRAAHEHRRLPVG